jgi:hypothetical protein
MEQSSLARQGTGQNLWIPKFHHRVHNIPPFVLSQINPVYIFFLFKYSNKTPSQIQQSIVKFSALSHRRCSTCFGHYYAHHQEPFQTVVATSGFHMNAEVDVFPAVVGLLQTC